MIYFLSLGSNLGHREQHLRDAMQQIEQQVGKILRCSSFYYSEPWGFDSPNPFCNLCCAVESTFSPLEVLSTTQAIERALGRQKLPNCEEKQANNAASAHKEPRYADRTIDIDIIRAFDDNGQEIESQISNQSSGSRTPLLTIPHPLWQQRDFVKVPLAEIMPL